MKHPIFGCCLILLLVLASRVSAQEQPHASPTRPSASDNGYLTAPGYTELEVGFALAEDTWTLPALLKLSLQRRLEVGFIMQGILNHSDFGDGDTELGDPGFQVKYQLADRPWGAVAVVGRVDFLSGSDPKTTVYSVVSYQAPTFQLDATLGGARFEQENGSHDESIFYAVAISRKLSGRVGGYAEIFGEHASGVSALSVDGGVSFAHSQQFVSDISLVLGLSDDAPDWVIQVGLTSVLVRVLGRPAAE
ncbi:MAG: hypothetical protein ACE5IY_11740 [bacterium]